MTFREACEYATRIGIADEASDYGETVLTLANGDTLTFASQYEEDLSDVTPGQGIMPPTVALLRKVDRDAEEATRRAHEAARRELVAKREEFWRQLVG